jgi:folate-dependent tRNA-U54 methylase TrmFO/GidA
LRPSQQKKYQTLKWIKLKINVVGGGLAGVEAAYYLLKKGYKVDMYEMRPIKNDGSS